MKTVEDIVQLMKNAGIATDRCDTLAPDQSLADQGLDSYDRMSLLFEVSELLDRDVPSDEASRLKTLEDIANYINAQSTQ